MKFFDEALALGFDIDDETYFDEEQLRLKPCYMVITPTHRQWVIPEGGAHYTMCWTAADVRRVINSELEDYPADCEICS